MIAAQEPKVKPNQRRKTPNANNQTRQRKTASKQTKAAKPKASAQKAAPPKADIPLEDVFTANATKGMVLLLIMAFNVTTLRNSFLLVAPNINFSGNLALDAWLYGFAMSVLMIVILFHEEQWNKAFCPGAIVLYVNALVLTLYMKWFDFVLGEWFAKWLLRGLLILMPVMGMFIVVVMLKAKK